MKNANSREDRIATVPVPPHHFTPAPRGLVARLARDAAGNTLAIVAASIAPILAMDGGGIDMGRSYLAESRLQQACDAGVLAARKKLDSPTSATASGTSPVTTAAEPSFLRAASTPASHACCRRLSAR